MRVQKILRGEVQVAGVGVHTGVEAQVILRPGVVGRGVRLVRMIEGERVEIPVKPEAVVNTALCTELGNKDGVTVKTVEHLFAALAGLEIYDVEIEIDVPANQPAEIPILDGSALPWVEAIEAVGLEESKDEVVPLALQAQKIDLERGGALVEAADGLVLGVEAGFPIAGFEQVSATYEITPEVFRKEIAPARTFCRLQDVEAMRAAGLIQGGSLDCACVFNDDGSVMNPEGLRFPDEPVRHKVLDLLGDLYVANQPLQGKIRVRQAGHGVNNNVLREIIALQD